MENRSEILIEVKGVSKKFSRSLRKSMWYGLQEIGNTMLGIKANKSKLRKDEFWAIKDVSFELRRGECLGLIGHNGAGKSTLLKMLNGLIRPDEGSITMRGKIGALIELGAGFNPILTGRENVYINGQLLGFSKKEIDEKLDSILEFAEIGKFVDSPVQNYSSGMKVRLGFAIAAQMEPDVLIIDEVLAVGDLGFRIKCLNRINELIKNACVIFVSHTMPQVSRICTSGLLLDHGKIQLKTENIGDLINLYYTNFSSENKAVFSSGKVEITNTKLISISDPSQEISAIELGEGISIALGFNVLPQVKKLTVKILFINKEMRNVLDVPSDLYTEDFSPANGKLELKVNIPHIYLNVGIYGLSLVLFDAESGERLLRAENQLKLQVDSKSYVSWSDSVLKAEWLQQ
jgi:lipopolysaccharide transport system ATP-binding protein